MCGSTISARLLTDLDLRAIEDAAVGGFQPVDFLVLVGDQRGPVELRLGQRPAEALGVLELVGEARGIDQKLLRHAAADHAGAAEAILLGDHHLRAIARRNAGGAHAARSGSDHEQIDFFRHGLALPHDIRPGLRSGQIRLCPRFCISARNLASTSSANLRRPVVGGLHRCFQRLGLFGNQFLAERRLEERQRFLQLLLGEMRSVNARQLLLHLRLARREVRRKLLRHRVQIPAEIRIGLHEEVAVILDHAVDQRIVGRSRALQIDQLFGEQQRRRARGGRRRAGAAGAGLVWAAVGCGEIAAIAPAAASAVTNWRNDMVGSFEGLWFTVRPRGRRPVRPE